MNRRLANEFCSCRQFLNGEAQSEFPNNDKLRMHVLNRAIECSMSQEHGLLNILNKLCDNSRTNGANLEIDITAENWAVVGDLITKLKSWKRMDEYDLLEYVLELYLNELKLKRALP